MFKICITILLQIIQFSTDERTLNAMRGSDPEQGAIEAKVSVEESVPGTFHPYGKDLDPVIPLQFHSIVSMGNQHAQELVPVQTGKGLANTL